MIVKGGLRWCIGDGTRINVWLVPWLRNAKNPLSQVLYSSNSIIDTIMMLWCLWKRRNEKIWENAEQLVSVSIQQARDFWAQWRQFQTVQAATTQANDDKNVIWQPPEDGEIKCNIDAAIFKELNRHGIGMFIRNNKGEFIRAKTMWFDGTPPAMEAEALGLKEAII
jgi:hypothetical protein